LRYNNISVKKVKKNLVFSKSIKQVSNRKKIISKSPKFAHISYFSLFGVAVFHKGKVVEVSFSMIEKTREFEFQKIEE
jgi:hypothetical protein